MITLHDTPDSAQRFDQRRSQPNATRAGAMGRTVPLHEKALGMIESTIGKHPVAAFGAALAAGIAWEKLIIDPGFGFGKDWRQNLELMRRLGELRVLGRPILVGTSRKSTIGRVLGVAERRNAGLPDAALSNTDETRRVVVEQIRHFAPRVVILPSTS